MLALCFLDFELFNSEDYETAYLASLLTLRQFAFATVIKPCISAAELKI